MTDAVDLEAQIEAIFDRAKAEALALVTKSKAVEPRWISLGEAAAERGVSRETMARHAEQYGLGTCTGRRWRIDANRLKALSENRQFEPLNPFPDECE